MGRRNNDDECGNCIVVADGPLNTSVQRTELNSEGDQDDAQDRIDPPARHARLHSLIYFYAPWTDHGQDSGRCCN